MVVPTADVVPWHEPVIAESIAGAAAAILAAPIMASARNRRACVETFCPGVDYSRPCERIGVP